MAEDILLSGGNSAALVVRRGDTLLKPTTPFDTATTALLTHFADQGIAGVPTPLGSSSDGRRILGWLPGDTAFPSDMWTSPATLTSAARQLRIIHDASVPLLAERHTWAYAYPDATRHAVICHNDFAPYNMTFAADGTVMGVFDFDLAGPGPRSRDLAYLAWWMVPLGQTDPAMAAATADDIAQHSRRLTSLCTSYGYTPDTHLLDMVTDVLTHMSDMQAATQMIGAKAASRLQGDGHFAHWAQARADFESLRPALAANLGL